MILFAIWYYLPANQQLRGRDICSYNAIKTNQTCYCVTAAAARTFFSNGTHLIIKYSKQVNDIPLGTPNVTIRYN
jgi:hypothetical protein